MEYSNLEKYIRTACSVLDFDYGELWCVNKANGKFKIYLPQ